MKATGIVRHIDELGRIVIPKEIRRTMRIRESDPLEIFTDNEGSIIFRKYSPVADLKDVAAGLVQSISTVTGLSSFVSDCERVIADAGALRRQLHDKPLSKDLIDCIQRNKPLDENGLEGQRIALLADSSRPFAYQCVYPITWNGNPIGAVGVVSDDEMATSEATGQILKTASIFLAKQLLD